MALENLFAAEPTLPNVQTHKLPDNVERWAEVLTTYLREQYPDTAKLPITVEFRKKDDMAGTAIGAMQVTSEEANKTVLVPFIVKKFELCPLDIWMEPKTQIVHPLSKDTFKEAFFVQSPADGMDARPADSSGQYFNDPSTWNQNYPPLQGRYSYASAGYEILDALSDSFTKEDGENFKEVLRNNPHLVAKFQKHGHADLITKLAKKTYVNSSDYLASAMQLIPTAAVSIAREDHDKYSVLQAVEGLYDLSTTIHMDREKCSKFLAKITGSPVDILNEVDLEGEKMLIIRKPGEGVFLYDKTEAGPEAANDFACYRVKSRTGLQLDGVVIPHVVNFAGKKQNEKLFISQVQSSLQPSIAGIRLVDDKSPMTVMKPSDIRTGQTGAFIYIDEGKAVATIPVTIKAIENSYSAFTVVDLNGKTFKVKRGYGDFFTTEEKEDGKSVAMHAGEPGMKQKQKRVYLDAHGMLEVRKDIFIIPENMMWVPLGDIKSVSHTADEYMLKEAGRLEIDPLQVRYTGIVYEVSGAGVEKTAMNLREVRLVLANAGLPLAKIASVLAQAKTHGKVKIQGTDRLGSKKDRASKAAAMIAKIASFTQSLKADLIKEAADIDDKQTVDALLSLNFLNSDNMAKFVAYKPLFDKVLDYLAELTLASRLGLKEVPEASIVGAMTRLMDVTDGLHKLQMSMKRPSTKTAAQVRATDKYSRAARLAAIGG